MDLLRRSSSVFNDDDDRPLLTLSKANFGFSSKNTSSSSCPEDLWEAEMFDAEESIFHKLQGQINIGHVLLHIFTFLEKTDKQTLCAVSHTCRAWRFYANVCPHWRHFAVAMKKSISKSWRGEVVKNTKWSEICTRDRVVQYWRDNENALKRLQAQEECNERLNCCCKTFCPYTLRSREANGVRLFFVAEAVIGFALSVGIYFASLRIGQDAVYIHQWSAATTGAVAFGMATAFFFVVGGMFMCVYLPVGMSIGEDDNGFDDGYDEDEEGNTLTMFGMAIIFIATMLSFTTGAVSITLLEWRVQFFSQAISRVNVTEFRSVFDSYVNLSSSNHSSLMAFPDQSVSLGSNPGDSTTELTAVAGLLQSLPSPLSLLEMRRDQSASARDLVMYISIGLHVVSLIVCLWLRLHWYYLVGAVLFLLGLASWTGLGWIAFGVTCIVVPDNAAIIATSLQDAAMAIAANNISLINGTAFYGIQEHPGLDPLAFCMTSKAGALVLLILGSLITLGGLLMSIFDK